jgi:hypothetical protein
MTININTLFANIGHLVNVAVELSSSYQDSEDAVRVFQESMDDEDQEIQAAVNEGLEQGLAGVRGSVAGHINALAASPLTRLIIETVHEDVPMLNKNLANALSILLAQMDDSSDTLDATTIGFTTVYGAGGSSSGITGDNYGNGIIVITERRGDNKVNIATLSETLRCAITATSASGEATWRFRGEPDEGRLSPRFPKGSAVTRNITSLVAASAANRVANGTFADEDDNAEYLPEYWIASEAQLGATLQITDVEVQTVTVNGTPEGGFYSLKFTDSDNREYWTDPLSFDASGAAVQSALQSLPFLGSVTVTTTGTSPNFTHSVVFYGVPNPHELDYDNQLTTDSSGGSPSITIDTVTPGAVEVMRGDRALEFIGDGSEETAIHTVVALSGRAVYCVALWALCDIAPAAGEMTVDLIDGIDGDVIEDDEGNANSFTVDLTSLGTYPEPHTGIFRTPAFVPPRIYLRLKLTTPLSAGTSLFLDEVILTAMTELYTGGPFVAAFTGAKNFRVGDTAEITVLNNREGQLHEWLHRLLNLGGSRIVFPTDSTGTLDDSLIV